MIVFDLACAHGHVFEAWFGSSEDYEEQGRRGLVSCPICDSKQIEKAAMAPRLTRKGNQLHTTSPTSHTRATDSTASVAMATETPAPAQLKAMMQALAQAQARLLCNSDYVGTRFADEARAIHLGESEERSIYGQTTIEEAKALVDEGVSLAPLPFPVRPPESDN